MSFFRVARHVSSNATRWYSMKHKNYKLENITCDIGWLCCCASLREQFEIPWRNEIKPVLMYLLIDGLVHWAQTDSNVHRLSFFPSSRPELISRSDGGRQNPPKLVLKSRSCFVVSSFAIFFWLFGFLRNVHDVHRFLGMMYSNVGFWRSKAGRVHEWCCFNILTVFHPSG